MALNESRMARYRREIEAEETRGSGVEFVKFNRWIPPKNKQVKFRVLPGQEPGSEDKDFFVKVLLHYKVSPSAKVPVVCPRTLEPSAECPVCAKVNALYKTGNEQDKKQASLMKARSRYNLGIIPIEGDVPENIGKIFVWTAPKSVKDDIISMFEDSDYGDVTDPRTGRDIKLKITGELFDTEYEVLPSPNASPISDDDAEIEMVLAAQPDLWKTRYAATADEIRKYMNGETNVLNQGNGGKPVMTHKAQTEEDAEVSSVFDNVVADSTVENTAPAVIPSDSESVKSPVPQEVPAPAQPAPKRKFDLSALQKQVAAINTNK